MAQKPQPFGQGFACLCVAKGQTKTTPRQLLRKWPATVGNVTGQPKITALNHCRILTRIGQTFQLDLGPTLVIKEAAELGGIAATSATDRSSVWVDEFGSR